MSSEPEIIDLGSFPLGSKPPALDYQWLDGDGDPVDMSSGAWTGQVEGEQLHVDVQPSPLFDGSVAIDAPTATATYTWGTDFGVVGRFRLILWAGNTVNRVGSPVFEYHVTDAPGDAPTV